MQEVDKYFKLLIEPHKSELQKIREIIIKEAPEAKELITYGMPGFKYKGKYLIAYGSFKDHMSLFPGGEVVNILSEDLQGFKTSKGTIQFTLEKPLSNALIIKIIDIRKKAIIN